MVCLCLLRRHRRLAHILAPVTYLKELVLVAGVPGQEAAALPAGEGSGSPEAAIARFQRHSLQQLPALFSQSGEGVRQMTAS